MNTSKRLDPFGAMLAAFRALYDAEIDRLAGEYRLRILAGEFSGTSRPPEEEEPRYFRLEREMLNHPWSSTARSAMAIIGISPWTLDEFSQVELTGEKEVRLSAAECMANDIMFKASARGWVKRPARGKAQYDAAEPYRLSVA